MLHKPGASAESPGSGLRIIEPRPSGTRVPRPLRQRPASCAGIAAVLLAIAVLFIPGPRQYLLKSVGRAIAASSPVVIKADIIIVAIDADGAGTLEAADLVQRGVSNQVAVFQDPPSLVDREFLRRGLSHEDRGAISILQLRSLGVSHVVQIPRSVSGSNEEGEILPDWCDEHNYRSAVLVTSWDHSRRLTRILRRSVKGHKARITVLSSPYSTFNPDNWWTSRAGVRLGIEEFQKLLLDILRHPFS